MRAHLAGRKHVRYIVMRVLLTGVLGTGKSSPTHPASDDHCRVGDDSPQVCEIHTVSSGDATARGVLWSPRSLRVYRCRRATRTEASDRGMGCPGEAGAGFS